MSESDRKPTPDQRAQAKKIVENVDIPYRAFPIADGKFTVFAYNHGQAFGIYSQVGPIDKEKLRAPLDDAITNLLHYNLQKESDGSEMIDGKPMRLYVSNNPKQQFIFTGNQGQRLKRSRITSPLSSNILLPVNVRMSIMNKLTLKAS